jgi:hypothetical protein
VRKPMTMTKTKTTTVRCKGAVDDPPLDFPPLDFDEPPYIAKSFTSVVLSPFRSFVDAAPQAARNALGMTIHRFIIIANHPIITTDVVVTFKLLLVYLTLVIHSLKI